MRPAPSTMDVHLRLYPPAAAPTLTSSNFPSSSLSLCSLFSLPSSPSRGCLIMSMEAGIGVMGTKLGMVTYFDHDGKVVLVTVVGFWEGNIVTQVKTAATDGYDAVQVGYLRVRDRKLTKPELGHLSKAGAIPIRHLQEFPLVWRRDLSSAVKLGQFHRVNKDSVEERIKKGMTELTRIGVGQVGKGDGTGVGWGRGAVGGGVGTAAGVDQSESVTTPCQHGVEQGKLRMSQVNF